MLRAACASGLVRHAPEFARRSLARKFLNSFFLCSALPPSLCVCEHRTVAPPQIVPVPCKKDVCLSCMEDLCMRGQHFPSLSFLRPSCASPSSQTQNQTILLVNTHIPTHRRGGGGDDGHTNTSLAKLKEDAGATGGEVDRVGSGNFDHAWDRGTARRRTMAAIRGQLQQQYQ